MDIELIRRAPDHMSVLKEYYARYLKIVRGLSESSVNHYFDALNNISRRLKVKGLVQQSIYEIADMDSLNMVREVLYADPEFIDLNERGRRMYSAGLNNYCRFASGEGFHEIQSELTQLDVPVSPEAAIVVEESVWRRSGILRTQAIEMAGYSCEINSSHKTFIAGSTNKPYMEGHHALPMNTQEHFKVSLDVYANIICLCPICHRKIHYGLRDDRVNMIKYIYDQRASRLIKSGIEISRDDFVEVAMGL